MSRSLSRLPACHSLIIHLDLNPQETPVTREFYIFFNNHGTEDTVSGRSFRRFSARRTSRRVPLPRFASQATASLTLASSLRIAFH